MIRKFASDVEQVINKYADKFGLKGFINFECSLVANDGEEEFTMKDGKKSYFYRCYGIAVERKDYVYVYFTMSEEDYSELMARDMAFLCMGIAAEEVNKRLQRVGSHV